MKAAMLALLSTTAGGLLISQPRCAAPRMMAEQKMVSVDAKASEAQEVGDGTATVPKSVPPDTMFSAAAELSGAAVIRATLGLDRGAAASRIDAERVLQAVSAFEAATVELPKPSFREYLQGSWRLVYSSSLADGGRSLEDVSRFAATLVDAPTARSSRVAIGDVSQRFSATKGGTELEMEETIGLRLRVPWPLPPAPQLEVTFHSSIRQDDAQVNLLNANLRDVAVTVTRGAGGNGALTRNAKRSMAFPAGRLRDRLDSAVPAPLAQLPTSRAIRQLDEAASRLSITAACSTVRVVRSGLGEVRVFAREFSSTNVKDGRAAQATASTVATSKVPPALDATALREIARVREEAEARGAEALQAAEKAAAKAAEETARMLELAAAENVALGEAKAEVEAALKRAEDELVSAVELAEAKLAAARAFAEAELAEALERASEEQAAAQAAFQADRSSRLADHREQILAIQTKAQADASEAQQTLALAKAQAEEDAAAARAAFAAEKQELGQRLQEAEARAAKAKAAAQAAIGDL